MDSQRTAAIGRRDQPMNRANRILLSLWVSAFCFPCAAMTGSPAAPEPLERPYAPLMTLMGGPLQGPLGDEEIARIATTFQFVNGHGGMGELGNPQRTTAYWAGPSAGRDTRGRTIGERIKAVNPEFILSNYRNGSYISQNCPREAAEAEAAFPLGIAVWETGFRLAGPVGADDTRLRLAPPAGRSRGEPAVRPFKAGTTAAEHSQSVKDYVAWLRLGDELLRIDAVRAAPEGGVELEVRRGLWGTRSAAHGPETPVLQPVYIGSVRAGADVSLSGIPDSTAPQRGLRYALQQQDPKFHDWLGDTCAATFHEGYDVVWLDVTSSAFYNNADAYGQPVVPWDVAAGRPLDVSTYREQQQLKIDALFKRFPQGKFFINNVKDRAYFDNGEERRFFSGEGGHHPVSGGSMELYAGTRSEREWRPLVTMTLDMVRNDFRAVAWAKGERQSGTNYLRFAYGTYLMAYEPGARLLFGFGNGVRAKPPAFLYWDLGKPLSTVDDARHPAQPGLYQREFSKARVLVNPEPRPCGPIALDREFYDPDTAGLVREVRLAPLSARILLLPATERKAPSGP